MASLARSSIGDLRALFAEQAKAQGFHPLVAAMLTALLFFDPAQQLVFAAAMLKHQSAEALQVFNALVADPALVEERGRSLVALQTPLWPADAAFAALRLAQFTAASPAGGAPSSALPRGFTAGSPTFSSAAGGFGLSGSGPTLASVGSGTTIVTVDGEVQTLRQQVRSLQQQLRSRQAPTSAVSRQTQPASQPTAQAVPADPARGRASTRGRGRTVGAGVAVPPPAVADDDDWSAGFSLVPQ
jgi:hypothetical protein